jgi:hypothetical protein
VDFEDPTFRNFMNLAFFLEDLSGRRVDLLTPEGISHRIKPYVEKEVVWADKRRFCLSEAYLGRDYFPEGSFK